MIGDFLSQSLRPSSLRRQGTSFFATSRNLESWMPAFAGMTDLCVVWRRGVLAFGFDSLLQSHFAAGTPLRLACARHLPRAYSAAGRMGRVTPRNLESWMPAFAGMTDLCVVWQGGWSSLNVKAPSVLRTAPPTSWGSVMSTFCAKSTLLRPPPSSAGGGARRAEGESA